MSLLHEPSPDDRELERYLLGLLPEQEEERLDQASIEDDSVASRLRMAEEDLIEGYLRRTLANETRQRFEAYFLSSARRRERVAFAARFLGAVDRVAACAAMASGTHDGNPAPGVGPRSDARRSVLYSKLVAWAAASAAVVLMASGLMLVNSREVDDLERGAVGESAARQPPVREPEQLLDAANAPTARKQDPVRQLEAPDRARPSASTTRAAPAHEAVTIAFVLLPQMRASGPVPVFVLPAGADQVAFELRLEPHDASRFEVALEDPATDRVVWSSGSLLKAYSGDEASLVVTVPSRALRPQHYVFHLNARDAGGKADVVGSYTFQIVPR